MAALSLEVTEVSRLGGRRWFRQEFGLQISRKNELDSSSRLASERGTRPPPGLATENDLYDNNRSVSSGFVRFRGKGQPPLPDQSQ